MTGEGITNKALYLTFALEHEILALDVFQVREVLELTPIKEVPRAPEFMRGVINVHGSIVPVVDLRTKFCFPVAGATANTRILIVETGLGDKITVLGAIVDAVNDVVELEPGQIEKASDLGDRRKHDFIKWIGKNDDQLLMILDVDRVFSYEDLIMVDGAIEDISEGIVDKFAECEVM